MDTVFEKYLDPTHQKYYYYNPLTEESVWEKPEGKILDCTEGQKEKTEIEAYLKH